MNVESNKSIYPEFGRNVLDGCIDDHDDIIMADPDGTTAVLQISLQNIIRNNSSHF